MSRKWIRKLLNTAMILLLLPILPLYAFADVPLLDTGSLELAAGSSQSLTVTIPEEMGKLGNVQWSSQDTGIATVSNGTVRAVAPGKTVVHLSGTLDSGMTIGADCLVEVFRPVASVKTETAATIGVGETFAAVVSVAPEDAKYSGVSFVSADETIAMVDAEGVITGVGPGSTTITITSEEPAAGKTAKSCKMTVKVIQKVQSVTLAETSLELAKGKSQKLSAEVGPENATNPKLRWESSDPAVAAVGPDGTVRAAGVGKAEITAWTTDESELSAVCQVEVYGPVTSLRPEKTSVTMDVDASLPLVVAVAPENAKYPGLTFTSSDETIVRVDAEGVITGVAPGKAKITATSAEPADTPQTAAVSVTVVQLARQIQLSTDKTDLARGARMTLEAAVLPDNTTNPRLKWETSDSSVVTVSNGNLTGVGVGTAQVRAVATDGSEQFAQCEVTVYQLVTGITSKTTRVAVTSGESVQLQPVVAPDNARNKGLEWYSENSAVASVDADGVVTGIQTGTVKITATAQDGSGKKLDFTVTVEPVVPLEAETFTRSGYFGFYTEFALTFRNLTKTRKINYIAFSTYLNYGTTSQRVLHGYTDTDLLAAGAVKKIGWWEMPGLNYARNVVIKLLEVRYTDGTRQVFEDQPIIGRFG